MIIPSYRDIFKSYSTFHTCIAHSDSEVYGTNSSDNNFKIPLYTYKEYKTFAGTYDMAPKRAEVLLYVPHWFVKIDVMSVNSRTTVLGTFYNLTSGEIKFKQLSIQTQSNTEYVYIPFTKTVTENYNSDGDTKTTYNITFQDDTSAEFGYEISGHNSDFLNNLRHTSIYVYFDDDKKDLFES